MIRAHVNLRARPDKRDQLLQVLDQVTLAAADDAFLIEIELHVSLDDPDRVLVVTAWPSPEHYERWGEGPGWPRILEAIEPLLAEEPETHVYRLVDSIG